MYRSSIYTSLLCNLPGCAPCTVLPAHRQRTGARLQPKERPPPNCMLPAKHLEGRLALSEGLSAHNLGGHLVCQGLLLWVVPPGRLLSTGQKSTRKPREPHSQHTQAVKQLTQA